MPVKRKYNVKRTNDYLVLAAMFFFLCLWSVKDAWFPSPKVLKNHPAEIEVPFTVAGSVEKVFVSVGDTVGDKNRLAKLRTDRIRLEYEEVKTTYTEAKKKFTRMELATKKATNTGVSAEEIAELTHRQDLAKGAMDNALVRVTEIRVAIDAADLISPSKGMIKEVTISAHSMVEAGEVVITIDPKDHFYLFNKSLAMFSCLLFWVFLAIHILAR